MLPSPQEQRVLRGLAKLCCNKRLTNRSLPGAPCLAVLRDVGILTLQLGRNLFRLALSNHLTRIWPRFSVQSAKSCSQDQRSGSLTSTRFGGTGACIAVSRRISSKSTHRDHRTGAARYVFCETSLKIGHCTKEVSLEYSHFHSTAHSSCNGA